MKLADIKGYVTSTHKHPGLAGQRLLVAQPVDESGNNDGAPQLVFDNLGAGLHQRVIITSDGSEARKMCGNELSPARWSVMGLIDPHGTEGAHS